MRAARQTRLFALVAETEMQSLVVCQSEISPSQFEQALDFALVAAIFGTTPRLLAFFSEAEFNHLANLPALTDKIAHLRELDTEICFSQTLTPSALKSIFEHADTIFSF